jgi:hypothetical protein
VARLPPRQVSVLVQPIRLCHQHTTQPTEQDVAARPERGSHCVVFKSSVAISTVCFGVCQSIERPGAGRRCSLKDKGCAILLMTRKDKFDKTYAGHEFLPNLNRIVFRSRYVRPLSFHNWIVGKEPT